MKVGLCLLSWVLLVWPIKADEHQRSLRVKSKEGNDKENRLAQLHLASTLGSNVAPPFHPPELLPHLIPIDGQFDILADFIPLSPQLSPLSPQVSSYEQDPLNANSSAYPEENLPDAKIRPNGIASDFPGELQTNDDSGKPSKEQDMTALPAAPKNIPEESGGEPTNFIKEKSPDSEFEVDSEELNDSVTSGSNQENKSTVAVEATTEYQSGKGQFDIAVGVDFSESSTLAYLPSSNDNSLPFFDNLSTQDKGTTQNTLTQEQPQASSLEYFPISTPAEGETFRIVPDASKEEKGTQSKLTLVHEKEAPSSTGSTPNEGETVQDSRKEEQNNYSGNESHSILEKSVIFDHPIVQFKGDIPVKKSTVDRVQK